MTMRIPKWLAPTALVLAVAAALLSARAHQLWAGDGYSAYLPIALNVGMPDARTPGWRYILNADAVSAVAIDPVTGHVWAVGSGGAVEWDTRAGSSVAYTIADGLPSHNGSAVTVTADGSVWVGTFGKGPALRLSGAPFNPISLGTGRSDNDVLALDSDPDGSMWLGTLAGATRVAADGTIVNFRREQGEVDGAVVSTALDGAGNRWFGIYGGGLSELRVDGTWHTVRAGDGSGLSSGLILQLAADHAGRIWVLSGDYAEEGGATRFQPAVDIVAADGTWSDFDVSGWFVDGAMRDVAFDAAGEPWFGTDVGVFVPQPDGTWRREGVAAGMPADQASDLAFDADGALWAATGKGLARRDRSGRWQTFLRGGLPGGSVSAIAVGGEGTAWIGTGRGGLARLSTDGTWRTYTYAEGLFGEGVRSLALDASGGVWLSSGNASENEDSAGVQYLAPDGQMQSYSRNDGLRSSSVGAMAVDVAGNVWFSCASYYYAPGQLREGGVTMRSPEGTWRSFGKEDGLPRGGYVRTLAAGPDGAVWAGTDVNPGAPVESLGRFTAGGAWERVPLPTAPGRDEPSWLAVTALAFDADGNLWIGTTGGVLVLSRAGEWTTPEDDPALAFRADAIARDATGTL